MSKVFSKISIIIILIVLIVGGIFAWQYWWSPKEEVKDETADWQTYRNDEYGFEIKYPETLILESEEKPISFRDSKDINNIKIFLTILDQDINEAIKTLPSESKEVLAGGKSAQYYSLGEDNQLDRFYYLPLSDSQTLEISAIVTEYGSMSFDDQFDLFDRMLSTFKFIEVTKQTEEIPEGATKYCKTDKDCACGVEINTRVCFYGNKDYVDTMQQCPDFCSGFSGDLIIRCTNNECEKVRLSQ